jgi:hypothetical protein
MAGLVTDSRVEYGRSLMYPWGNRINGTIFSFSAAMSQRGIYLVFFLAIPDIGQFKGAAAVPLLQRRSPNTHLIYVISTQKIPYPHKGTHAQT